jgi:DNA-binding XRE family transcriptional regulator
MIPRALRNRLIRSAILMAAESLANHKSGAPLITLPKGAVRGSEAVRVAVGANVRAARLAADLTQAELAKKAKTSTRTISGIEKGTQDAKLTVLASIDHALSKRVADLVTGT